MKNPCILLASNSPRRREILSEVYDNVLIMPAKEIEENYPDSIPLAEVPVYIATKKRNAYSDTQLRPGEILITADTVVILDGEILGKPHNIIGARKMLRKLSGNTHTVVTGVTLTTYNHTEVFSVATNVTFDTLTTEEINYYLKKYRPFDKAGSYGIQEWIGMIGISSIEGDYYNVMGLPINALFKRICALPD